MALLAAKNELTIAVSNVGFPIAQPSGQDSILVN
jgi:hypothetical protein